MKSCQKKICIIDQINYRHLGSLLLLFFSFTANSQIAIYTIQGFDFGSFYQGNSGGTVDISNTGIRSATGDIILINSGPLVSQAAFEIEAPEGSVISIINGPDISIAGSNGGTISLKLGGADTGSPFITTEAPPTRTRIQIGGTLTIGNKLESPPGNYQGTFTITLNQE